MPLHSSLSSEEQSLIFCKTKQRKIVISTNLAETSITIDDCVFVVEVGKMKEKRFDPTKNMESLGMYFKKNFVEKILLFAKAVSKLDFIFAMTNPNVSFHNTDCGK